MDRLTMPQAAERFGLKLEHICFAARLGRLPVPVDRAANGHLLFDAGQLAKHLGVSAYGEKQ